VADVFDLNGQLYPLARDAAAWAVLIEKPLEDASPRSGAAQGARAAQATVGCGSNRP